MQALTINQEIFFDQCSKQMQPLSRLISAFYPSILPLVFSCCVSVLLGSLQYWFITCLGFCAEIIVASRRRAEPFHCNFENVLKLTKDTKQLADITYFLLEDLNKQGFFEILSPQWIVLVPSFLCMTTGITSKTSSNFLLLALSVLLQW